MLKIKTIFFSYYILFWNIFFVLALNHEGYPLNVGIDGNFAFIALTGIEVKYVTYEVNLTKNKSTIFFTI